MPSNHSQQPRRKTIESLSQISFFNTIFVSSHMYPENPEGTQVIVGSMNMGYISDTARNRTHNLFRPKREPIPLGHSGLQIIRTVSHSCIHSILMPRVALIPWNIWHHLAFRRIISTMLQHPIQPPCYIPGYEMPLEIMQASCVGASVSFDSTVGERTVWNPIQNKRHIYIQ